jgi:hypothetical protein
VSIRLAATVKPNVVPALTALGGILLPDREADSLLRAVAQLAVEAGPLVTAGAWQLTEALGTRDLIGTAKGILMEREAIDEDAAFGLLRSASQRSNRSSGTSPRPSSVPRGAQPGDDG